MKKWKLSLAVIFTVCAGFMTGTYYYIRGSIQQSQRQLIEAQQNLSQKSQALVELIPQFLNVLKAVSLKETERRRLRSAEHFYQRAHLLTGASESYNRSERELMRATKVIQGLIQLGQGRKDIASHKTFIDLVTGCRQLMQESFDLSSEIYAKDNAYRKRLASIPERWVANFAGLRSGPPVPLPKRQYL